MVVEGKSVGDKVTTKEFAPRFWIPVQIEGQAPQQFWRGFPLRAPPALSDVDLSEHRPYWESYPEDSHSFFLTPLDAPSTSMDENDEGNRHPGAKISAADVIRKHEHEKQKRIRKMEERRSRPLPPSPFSPFQVVDHGLRPEANVYFRPVIANDAKGIQVRFSALDIPVLNFIC